MNETGHLIADGDELHCFVAQRMISIARIAFSGDNEWILSVEQSEMEFTESTFMHNEQSGDSALSQCVLLMIADDAAYNVLTAFWIYFVMSCYWFAMQWIEWMIRWYRLEARISIVSSQGSVW